MTTHIFIQRVLEGIHSVPLSCLHEKCQIQLCYKRKKTERQESFNPDYSVTIAQPGCESQIAAFRSHSNNKQWVLANLGIKKRKCVCVFAGVGINHLTSSSDGLRWSIKRVQKPKTLGGF